nr:hypothetical protein [Natrinema hispanicum]
MNRRNVLVGLGGIVATGGAALSTGAFSQVQADRSVNVSTSGDGSAYVQFTQTDSTYVTTSAGPNSNQFKLQLGSLNEDAVSTFNSLFDIEVSAPDPDSSDTVTAPYYVYIQSQDNVGSGKLLDIQDSSSGTIVGSSNAKEIDYSSSSWGNIQDIGVVVDNDSNDPSTEGVSYPSSITVVVQNSKPEGYTA